MYCKNCNREVTVDKVYSDFGDMNVIVSHLDHPHVSCIETTYAQLSEDDKKEVWRGDCL